MDAAIIARVCHEANRTLQEIQGDPTIPISDSWFDITEETRQSAVQGVQAILDDPDLTPEQSHENWSAFKIKNGWKLGPVKDEAKKEHPLLVPYSELPKSQQIKDSLFGGIVRALASAE